MTFLEWLLKQTKRDDGVGNLAKDTRYKLDCSLLPKHLRGESTKKDWREYISTRGIGKAEKTLSALDDAWDEFTSDDPFAKTPAEGQGSLF